MLSGNIDNFISLLREIGRKDKRLNSEIKTLIYHLVERSPIDKIDAILAKIDSIMKEKLDMKEAKKGCDKVEIFLSYLAGLNKNGYNVEIFTMPAEYQLRGLVKTRKGDGGLCDRAGKFRLPCYDLTPYFLDYYSNKDNNSLYVDGSHLAPEGSKKVASWIMELRGMNIYTTEK